MTRTAGKTFREQLLERDLLEPLERIARKHGCTVEELPGRKLQRHYVAARRDAALHLSEELGWSSTAIGSLLDRDHSSILSMLKKKEPA